MSLDHPRRSEEMSHHDGERSHPVHGVFPQDGLPTIVFVTICTEKRRPWLATAECHERLLKVWREATAWIVGRYVVMPDHIHLFAAPGRIDLSLESWIKYWKSRFSRLHKDRSCRWQTDHWDRRLRNGESYESKWEYARNNAVRHGLVMHADEWPFQGVLHELRWER
jgi:putative transposase